MPTYQRREGWEKTPEDSGRSGVEPVYPTKYTLRVVDGRARQVELFKPLGAQKIMSEFQMLGTEFFFFLHR